VRGESIDYSAHGVFAHAEMQNSFRVYRTLHADLTRDAGSAARLPAILRKRLFQDSTNALAPSRCKRDASARTSTPALANSDRTDDASPPSTGIGVSILPWSANASSVFSGIVLMVSGATSASM
jgi:hypothetical protein